MEYDALTSSRPVETHVETVDEISQMFDTIAYSKVNIDILKYIV